MGWITSPPEKSCFWESKISHPNDLTQVYFGAAPDSSQKTLSSLNLLYSPDLHSTSLTENLLSHVFGPALGALLGWQTVLGMKVRF